MTAGEGPPTPIDLGALAIRASADDDWHPKVPPARGRLER